jgi:ubiquinone/menaquinone biosynthesis C-methylase UbiE
MASLSDQELIQKFKLKSTDKILDVGGSMMQHKEIPIDTLVDAIRPEESQYNKGKLLAKHFVRLDFNRDKFPFKDKEFDFCLCTHTLEDLPYPFLVIDEMSRVAKAGYIATPSFGQDIVFTHIDFTNWGTGARRVPGISHHKWLFYVHNAKMRVVPKNYPLLYSEEFQYVKWMGEEEFRFPWKGKIAYEEFRDFDFKLLIKEYRDFESKNKTKLQKGKVLFYLDNPQNLVKGNLKRILKRK